MLSQNTTNNIEKYRKSFFESQKCLKEYLKDAGSLNLSGMLKDSTIVYTHATRLAVLREEARVKQIKRIVNKINKIKKKDILDSELDEIVGKYFIQLDKSIPNENNILHTMNDLLGNEDMKNISNEQYTNIVKHDLDLLRNLPEFVPRDTSITRNFTQSASHHQIFKKYEIIGDSENQKLQGNFSYSRGFQTGSDNLFLHTQSNTNPSQNERSGSKFQGKEQIDRGFLDFHRDNFGEDHQQN